MVRNFILVFFSAVLVAEPPGQHRTLDPAFEKVPFDQWLRDGTETHFRWKTRVARAELSFHQRLVAPVEIVLDGADLETRRGNGRMLFLFQITDREGTRYQDHSSVELSKLDENIKAVNLEIAQRAFFLPGDYQLAVAIFDTVTGEHSTRRRIPKPKAVREESKLQE